MNTINSLKLANYRSLTIAPLLEQHLVEISPGTEVADFDEG